MGGGGNAQADAEAQASQQSAQAQQQLNNTLIPMYQGLYQNYQQNVAPIQAKTGSIYGNLLSSGQPTDAIGNAFQALQSPSALDASSGINLQGIDQNTLNYLLNTGGTNLAQMTPGAISGLQGSNANVTSQLGGDITGLQGLIGGGMGTQATQQAISYLQNNPGLPSSVWQNALGQQGVQNQQTINNLRNQLGGALPNLGGTVNDLGFQGMQSMAGLNSSLASQDAMMRQQSYEQAAGLGQSLQNMQASEYGSEANIAGSLAGLQQNNIMAQLQASGALDTQTQQMLDQASTLASQESQQWVNNLMQAAGLGSNILQGAGQFAQGGQGLAGMATSGYGGLAQQYGNQAVQYANQAGQLYAETPNPFMQLAQLGLGAGAMFIK